MAKQKRSETPRELVNYIKSVLSDKWTITVAESTHADWDPLRGAYNTHFWYAMASMNEPLRIQSSVHASNFPELVKAVNSTLWDKLKQEFMKQQTAWSPNPQAIEAAQPKIAGRQLALTHQPGV